MQACGGRFEYELEGESPLAQPASSESTDGSWTAALGELLLPLIEDHDTEYAPGYSDKVFRALDFGTGRVVVEQLLGPPLLAKEFPSGETYLYYSRHGKQFGSYFIRILVLDGAGLLVARRSYFYLD